MHCIVTGGAGFIGSHLVDRLVREGHQVSIIDNFSTGKREHVKTYVHEHHPLVTVFEQDISKGLDLVRLFKSIHAKQAVDVVFHVAALPGVQFSIKDPIASNAANVLGTLHVLTACKEVGIKRIVFSSSCSVYGDQDTIPFTETMNPNPLSPYALEKLTGEHYCQLFHALYGLETISLRYFNVYGPRQNPEGAYACLIPKVITTLQQNKSPIINGDGEQTRDFIFVSDVVEANIIAATITKNACFGKVFNVGSGKGYSVNEVVMLLMKWCKVDKNIYPQHGSMVVEPKNTLGDITLTKALLGWQPTISFEDGLRETCVKILHQTQSI